MSKTKKIKGWLLALLTALLVCCFGFALAQILPASAAEDGVLEGNTAEYTFENDEKYPWSYNRAGNTWISAIQGINNGETTLTLTATSDGDIIFDYLVSSEIDSDKLTIKHKTIAVVDGENGDNQEFSNKKITVASGDTITFTYKKDSNTDSYDDCVYVKGLRVPDFPDVTVTVTAGANGTLSYGEQTGQSSFTENVKFGGTFEVEAVANEGANFIYWENEAHKIVSYSAKLDYFFCATGTYTAVFLKDGETKTSISQINGQPTWKLLEDYYEADMSVIQNGQTGTLTIDFVGEGYFCCDYKVSVNYNEYLNVYLDGVRAFYGNSYNTKYHTPDEVPWEHEIYALQKKGYHRIEFVYEDKGAQANPSGGHLDIAYVKNIQAPVPSDELNLVEYEINFNQELGDVYILMTKYSPDIDEFAQKGQMISSGQKYEIAADCVIFFGIFPHKEYSSSIDSSKTTNTIFVGSYLRDGTELSRYGLGVSEDYAFYMKAEFNDEGVTAGGKQSAERYLEFRMQEQAIAPRTVSVNYKVDDHVYDKEDIENGETYTIPYGSNNQFTVAISDYPNVSEELKVTANGEPVHIELVSDHFGFVLNDLAVDTTVSIQIKFGECYESDPFLIHIKFTLDGERNIQDDLNPLGKVKIENDENRPWTFSSTYSNGEEIAYIAGNSGYGKGKGNSSLKFTVTGNGTLTFDFYLAGASDYSLAGYNFNEPLGDADYGVKFKDGKGKVIASGQCASGNVYKESKIVDSNVVTSLKETLGSGWFHANIPVSTSSVGSEVVESTEVVVYVAYGVVYDNPYYKDDVMAIRNIMYLQGKSTVNFKTINEKGEDDISHGSIEAKIANNGVVTGSEADMGDKLVLTAIPTDGNSFYMWRDFETKEFISYDPSITITVVGNVNVEAVLAKAGTYAVRNGNTFYAKGDLVEALTAASSAIDKNVYFVDDFKGENAIGGDFTIPKGVALILPINDKGDYYAEGNTKNATNRVSWGTPELEKKYRFRTVTFSGNVTVAGELYVGGVLHYPDQSAQAHTSGAYAELVLNGAITVADGGMMDVCGRVTGSGQITVKEGGKILQPFLILDYSGGQNTQSLYGIDQTPFNRYSVINVQCAKGLKIEYKGELLGHASLYFWGSITAIDAPIISYSDGTEDQPRGFITLTEGGSVTALYHDDADRKIPDANAQKNPNNTIDIGYTELIFESSTKDGGAIANSLTMTYSIITISTANVVGFSVPYNYQITLRSGSYKLEGNFKLMPGASLTVEEDATLTVGSGQNLLVYDGLVQSKMSGKSYPSASDLRGAGYTTNANFTVNGTLVIEEGKEKYPSMLLGVIQTTNTKGTARIEIGENVILAGKIVDGGLTDYDCNQMEYESSARLYDKVAGHEKLTSIPVGEDGMTHEKLIFTSDYSGTETFDLPAVDLMWDDCDSYASKTAQNHKPHGTEGGHWVAGKTELVTGLTGAWKLEHSGHQYDWSQLSDEEKNLNGKKYKELTHQCTEIGCTEEEHKLLLAEGFDFHAAYKGAEFTDADLLAIFYQYYFGQTTVPAQHNYFSASVTGATSIQNVQTYKGITVTLTNGYFGDVSKTSATKAFTVDKFDVKNLDKSAIKNAIEEKKFTYDGTAKQLSNEELEAVLTAEGLTGAVSHEAFVWANNTKAGTASVTIKGSGTNFEGELTVNFSIAKAQLTVTLQETTQTYGEEVKTPDITLDGVVNNEESQIKAAITRTPKAEQWSEVGNYAVDWSYSEGEGVLANYEISFNNKEETLYRVTAKDITKSATATAESATYNGKEQEAKLSFTFEGYTEHFGTGDYTVSYAKDGETSPVNAGTYTVTIKAQGNYSGSITCNYTIEKAQVIVTVTQQTYTFDRTQHSYNDQADGAWTAEGLQNEENKSLLGVSITGSGTDANTYAVTCSYNENGNYTVTFEGKDTALVIEAAEIDSVTVTSSHTYDGQTYTPTLTVKAGELELNPSEYDVSYDKEEVKNADTYTVTVTAKESGNFKDKAEKASAQFRIEKATVTITAENKHSPQKQDLLELTAKVEGLVGNDELQKDVDYTLTLPEGTTKDSAVDTYTITVTVKEGREAAWPNYEIKTVNGQYQITIAAFAELVFNDASKPYNGEAQKIEATLPHSDQGEYSVEYAYWKGEAESGQSISADEMVNAGKYTIVATVSFADNNGETYEATFTATLTIEKIKVTVKFEAKSSTYGDAVETDLTYTMSEGVLAKDTETVKAAIEPYTDAESKSNAGGSYKITAAKPVLDNYDVTIEDGVYTITARPVTVTVKKQTVTFNQGSQKASSETGYWTVDGLAAGDEASALHVKLEAEGTDAKAYDITASYHNNNYMVTFKGEGDFTVEGNTVKAAFVIEAATLTGAELTGSYTYNGNEQTPTFTVKAGSLTVAEGDYELAYADGADRVSAGTVQVTVQPKSENYTGTVETQFTIAQKQIKVTLTAQTAEYSGEVPTPAQDKYTVEEGGLCSRNGKEDDLGITITLVNGQKDAGDYGLTAEASNDDYEVTFEKSAKFTVTKKAITVKADDLTSVYGEAVQKLTYTAEGLVAGEDPQTVLKIELQASRSIKEAGTYEVTGTGSATNYTFEVTPGTYTVKEREVTVRINDQTALYNGKEPSVPQEQNKGWTITDGSIIDGDNLLIVLTKEAGVNADDYEINGAFTNDNYKVTFEGTLGTAGKFTIDARTLTVVIEDQSATYNYQHQYTFDTAKWHVKTGVGDGLAEGEEKDVLAVTLTKPEMTDAGDYEIAGAWDNENYTVTFEGTKQTKGTFTVEKQDVSDGAEFVLGVEGDFTTDGARGVRAKFAGEELVLFASASYLEGTKGKSLEVTIDPAKIGEIGEFEVTVTIADKNYCGSTVFSVVVTDAAGYTKKLTEVLERLETLAKRLDIDALKAEDYATLTEMYKAMQTLDEEERETGAPALAEYQAYIDAWNALADTDAAAETAESIANGPIKGLFAGTAVMTALAALAYIVKKGGIL